MIDDYTKQELYEENKKLKASLGAIHCHSTKFSVRVVWGLVPKKHLAATLASIRDECVHAVPILSTLRPFET